MPLAYTPKILPLAELYERFGGSGAGEDGEEAVLSLAGGTAGAVDRLLAAIRDAESTALSYLRRSNITISTPSTAPAELKAVVANHALYILYSRRLSDLPGPMANFRSEALDFYSAVVKGDLLLEGVQTLETEPAIAVYQGGHRPYSSEGLSQFLRRN